MNLALKPNGDQGSEKATLIKSLDLGNGSQVVYMPRFLSFEESWHFFHYLDSHIPWTRPTLRVFGRPCIQPRDSCYVANPGLPELVYSGCKPQVYTWDDYPPLKDILDAVHRALPGSKFNSLLLNRYKGGNDNVGWHADDEKLYGPTPEIASVSFGCERDFLLKKRPTKSTQGDQHFSLLESVVLWICCKFLWLQVAERRAGEEPAKKRLKKNIQQDQHCFKLKHGSLLVMKGYTQRDWLHSVPKRAKADATRINLTFRLVL